MRILPAIDLKNGACVRLRQGQDNDTTQYSDDPVAVAKEWVRQGAEWIHVVNLDGAFGRESENLAVVRKIVAESGAKVEFGGGLRSVDLVRTAFESGVEKAVLGTAVFTSPGFLTEVLSEWEPSRVIVAVDAHNGKVAVHGWQAVTSEDVVHAAERFCAQGVAELLYTDIRRDGMLGGTDMQTLQRLLQLELNIIASGGVGSLKDLLALAALKSRNLSGVVVGKALYERRFTLEEAIRLVNAGNGGE